ncbi:hypothetical protein [Rhodopirellula sp. SWK7]|uniref:hypothetical protein n=1 Tax=Rhodopirellula sp. SWK7 TaxID=595460 RepID=UPI0002BDEDC0|nr:hypothetical protein [Rhodopirellula sp. SWK7]EMI47137.1 hypothetical protein RRSWK_00143 [Rhodopirellula sp. SWK7]
MLLQQQERLRSKVLVLARSMAQELVRNMVPELARSKVLVRSMVLELVRSSKLARSNRLPSLHAAWRTIRHRHNELARSSCSLRKVS